MGFPSKAVFWQYIFSIMFYTSAFSRDANLMLNASFKYIYEAGSQVGICENQWIPLFEDFGTRMSKSVEKYLDVVGTWLIVR